MQEGQGGVYGGSYEQGKNGRGGGMERVEGWRIRRRKKAQERKKVAALIRAQKKINKQAKCKPLIYCKLTCCHQQRVGVSVLHHRAHPPTTLTPSPLIVPCSRFFPEDNKKNTNNTTTLSGCCNLSSMKNCSVCRTLFTFRARSPSKEKTTSPWNAS